jgi:Fic family protein
MIGFLMLLTYRQQNIIHIVENAQQASISQIQKALQETISIPTLNRELADLVAVGYLEKIGEGRRTAYILSDKYHLLSPLNTEQYFDLDPDKRNAKTGFNATILTLLEKNIIFTKKEENHLQLLQKQYQYNLIDYPKSLYQKEIERLTIELSWKSSQIEGNTYSLLETERLFKEKMVAPNKPKEDATMLLNHKDALNYLLLHTDIAKTLNLRLVEEIHSFLISELGVDRNIRSRTVGITGSAYKPIDNQFQIREAVEHMCRIINLKENIFEKALLALVLISYIQPFEDGNKRTGRMISNALLIAGDMCPLSYRSVDSIEYKKAMLLFYEQNNLYAFKNLFIEQIEFSVKNYFQ